MPHEKQKEIFADCDQQGEEEVRNQLAWGRWNAAIERHVRLWLDRKDSERMERSSKVQMKLRRQRRNVA